MACEEHTILNAYFSSEMKLPLSEHSLKVAETVFSRTGNVFIILSRLNEVGADSRR